MFISGNFEIAQLNNPFSQCIDAWVMMQPCLINTHPEKDFEVSADEKTEHFDAVSGLIPEPMCDFQVNEGPCYHSAQVQAFTRAAPEKDEGTERRYLFNFQFHDLQNQKSEWETTTHQALIPSQTR